MIKPPKMGAKFMQSAPTIIDEKTKLPEPWNVPEDGRPSINAKSNQIPEIAEWKVGERYKLEIEVELVSLEKNAGIKGDYYASRMRISSYSVESETEEKNKHY